MEAVKKGTSVIAVKGTSCVVLGVEKKSVPKLQDPKSLKKIVKIDDHIYLAFAGLNADARVLIDKARVECQSYRLTVEMPPTVEYLARYIAKVQQDYTQKGGRRPFGISNMIIGIDINGPQLYYTDPSGSYSSWKANASGRSGDHIKEVLEKKWKDNMNEGDCLELVVKCLGEIVENGSKSMEIVIMDNKGIRYINEDNINDLLTKINNEAKMEEETK